MTNKQLEDRLIALENKVCRCCSGEDTNMGNTDLVFEGSRTYDGEGATITYNDVGVMTINTTNVDGITLVNQTTGDLAGLASIKAADAKIDLYTYNFDGFVANISISQEAIIIGNATGVYYLGDDFLTQAPPTYADDTAAGLAGFTKGRLYQTPTGQLMIKL
jgi:hypothetical protein